MPTRSVIDVRDVPPEIRAAVEGDAQARNVSVNDVVGEALSGWAGLEWTPSGYPFSGVDGSNQWNLRIPKPLHDVVRAHAAALPGGTQRGVVLLVLADHYDLPKHSPRSRRATLTLAQIADARARNAAGESIHKLAKEYGVKRDTLTRAIRA